MNAALAWRFFAAISRMNIRCSPPRLWAPVWQPLRGPGPNHPLPQQWPGGNSPAMVNTSRTIVKPNNGKSQIKFSEIKKQNIQPVTCEKNIHYIWNWWEIYRNQPGMVNHRKTMVSPSKTTVNPSKTNVNPSKTIVNPSKIVVNLTKTMVRPWWTQVELWQIPIKQWSIPAKL